MKANSEKSTQPATTRDADDEQPVRFLMTCAAPAGVCVMLRREDGSVVLCAQMEPEAPSRWGLTLRLRPGTYRYRYYVENGRVMNYVSPADVDVCPVQMDGADAVVTVTPEKNPKPCSAASVCGAGHRCHRRCGT